MYLANRPLEQVCKTEYGNHRWRTSKSHEFVCTRWHPGVDHRSVIFGFDGFHDRFSQRGRTMEITEVRLTILGEQVLHDRGERLKAFATFTLDCMFTVHDAKVISGEGGLFVAMPSRKLTDKCPTCNAKNHLQANYCSQCGVLLGSLETRARRDIDSGKFKLYADTAHPICNTARDRIHQHILEAYHAAIRLRFENAVAKFRNEELQSVLDPTTDTFGEIIS